MQQRLYFHCKPVLQQSQGLRRCSGMSTSTLKGTLAPGLGLIAATPFDFSHPAPAGLCTVTGTAITLHLCVCVAFGRAERLEQRHPES